MYRILLASSGYYYVQQKSSSWQGWSKIGGFFATRISARNFIKDWKSLNKVVEYVS